MWQRNFAPPITAPTNGVSETWFLNFEERISRFEIGKTLFSLAWIIKDTNLILTLAGFRGLSICLPLANKKGLHLIQTLGGPHSYVRLLKLNFLGSAFPFAFSPFARQTTCLSLQSCCAPPGLNPRA